MIKLPHLSCLDLTVLVSVDLIIYFLLLEEEFEGLEHLAVGVAGLFELEVEFVEFLDYLVFVGFLLLAGGYYLGGWAYPELF